MKTIGQRLKEEREYRHLNLERVASDIHIRVQYLQALEADDFSQMPSPVQARGFLRNYAQYLGVDLDDAIDELRQSEPSTTTSQEIVFEQEAPQEIAFDQEDPSAVEPVPEAKQPSNPDEEQHKGLPFWNQWMNRLAALIPGWQKEEEPGSTHADDRADREDLARETEEGAPPAGVEIEAIDSERSTPDVSDESGPDEQPALRATLSDQDVDEASPRTARADGEPGSEGSPAPSLWETLAKWFQVRIVRQTEATEEEERSEIEVMSIQEAEPAPSGAGGGEQSSQEILNEVGLQLRERREMLSLSLEEIERHTRMRARYLLALESGDFDELPSTVQTRGMLQSYASFLDLDVDAILLRFADALQARHREKYPEKPTGRRVQPSIPETLPRLRTFIAGDLVFGLGMVLLLMVFAVWGISRVIALQSQTPEVEAGATNPSISEALIGTPVEQVATEMSPIPVADTPLPEAPAGTQDVATPVENVAVRINIVVLERTYLRVRVDGETVFDRRALPGNAYPFEAEQSIDVLAGNAAALRLTYNQRDLGLLGGFGEVVNLVFTAQEIMTPTPEPTPTPTETQPVTPSPTFTPPPTPTPEIEGENL